MRQVYYDITHLRHNAGRNLISGIRRVDFEFARYFLGRRPDAKAIHYKVGGPMVIKHNGYVERLITDSLVPYAVPRAPAAPGSPHYYAQNLMSLTHYAPTLRDRGVKSIAPGAVYLNTAQHALAYRLFFNWLAARRDVKAVFFVHDLIPLDRPEYWRRGYQDDFRAGIAMLAEFGAAFLVSTDVVKERLTRELRKCGRQDVPILSTPFPDFRLPPTPSTAPGDDPYFVMVGTIEPRKNHLMILQVWCRMAELGGPVPKLFLLGQRGWESEHVVSVLERCKALNGHVIEVPTMSDAAMRQMVRGARALLMPSFDEGFGLPLAEALFDGTPVVASDLAVLRETSQGKAIFRDPIDGLAWMRTIMDLCTADGCVAREARELAGSYVPVTREDYFSRIEAFLETI